MQTLSQVHLVTLQIAKLGFTTGVYVINANKGENVRYVCFAGIGPIRRYFRVDKAGTKEVQIFLINRSESGKQIEKVNTNLYGKPISLEYLVKGGYEGILRGFGFYKVLYEKGQLKREDFSLSNLWESVELTKCGYNFVTQIRDEETLEVDTSLPCNGFHTVESARVVAKEWKGDCNFAVVVNEYGFTVAVYRKGVLVL